ncbi:putative ankyrin repeat protein RF_0381 [Microplitis mediator]|uniref:putative ankyrin repeat protein RF_0381 n=1 Tax=Microplitis mediator TaxID=375433 RepID=UPI00255300EA|nr:putative ankyrin repeat protein RF_0381 [Microplitis mediator]
MNTREAEEREAREKYFAVKKDLKNLRDVNKRFWYPSLGHPNLLQLAVYFSHVEFASQLISRGADVNVVTDVLGTPLHIAVRQRSLPMIELLLISGANPHIFSLAYENILRRWTPIYDALEIDFLYSDESFIRTLLDNGTDVNEICFKSRWDPNGRTPLQIAVNQGEPSWVQLFLDYGANINVVDSFGRTPLEAAVVANSPDIVLMIRNRIIALHQQGLEVSERNLQSVFAITIN